MSASGVLYARVRGFVLLTVHLLTAVGFVTLLPSTAQAAMMTERVSVSSVQAQAVGGDSASSDITPDGRYVVFDSFASNLTR